MNERYWEAGYPPVKLVDELSAWVDKNVCEAIDNSWECVEKSPIGWIEEENGEWTVIAAGPERYDDPDMEGDVDNLDDIYKIKLNLISCLEKYSKNNKKCKNERTLVLMDLAKRVLEIAGNIE